jgi:hypothetical protein
MDFFFSNSWTLVCCPLSVSGAEVRRQFSIEEEDELLQFAIQQSLIEAGSEKDEVLFKSS